MSNKLVLLKLIELWKAHRESATMAKVELGAMNMAFADQLAFNNYLSENTKQIMEALEEIL